MRQLLILLFIHSLTILIAQSQDVGHSPAFQQAELEAQFKSDRVTEERLRRYHHLAEQKLRDWLGYLELASNSEYPAAMRQQAMEAAEGLFSSKAGQLNSYMMGKNKASKLPAANFHKRFLKEVQNRLHYSLSNLQQTQALAWSEDCNCYTGQLSFQLKTTMDLPASEQVELVNKQVLDYQLEKVKKKYGRETREVWELRLQALDLAP